MCEEPKDFCTSTSAFVLSSFCDSFERDSGGQDASSIGICSAAQESAVAGDLDSQVRELRALVEQMRTENAQSRAEMQELRQELQDTRKLLTAARDGSESRPNILSNGANPSRGNSATATALEPAQQIPAAAADLGSRVQKLEESTQLLGSKIDEQYQTKVETAAKYRARLSGIVLMNAFRNVGSSDNLDFPNYAQPAPAGHIAGQLGRHLAADRNRPGNFRPNPGRSEDFGQCATSILPEDFPSTPNGVNFGIVRLQTASLRLDWEHTSVDRRPGFAFHLAAFSHFVCVAGHAGLRLCRKSVGLDAATSRRASLRSCRPTRRLPCRRNSGQSRLGASFRSVLSLRASGRTVRSAGLCDAHGMVAASVRTIR